jgi:hypothetical protein
MDAGVVDLWWFGTACELLFGRCVSSVSHGHRLAHSQEIQPPLAFPKGYVRSRLVQPPPLTLGLATPGANHVVALLSVPAPCRDMRPPKRLP